VIVTFEDGTDTITARPQVLERVARTELPATVQPVLEPDVGSLREIYRYALHSNYYSAAGLRAIQQWDLEKVLLQTPGVVGVVSQGGPTRAFHVDIDQDKARARDISLTEIYDAVARGNATSGGGFIEKSGQVLMVRELGALKSLEDLRNIVIRCDRNGTPIKISDVAEVRRGCLVRRGQVGKDDEDDIVEGIVLLRRGENPTRVLDHLYQRLPMIVHALPEGVFLETIYDRSDLIRQTLKTVGKNVTWGIILVIGVLCLFLVDIPPALLTASVLPIAILIAFISLSILGVPTNLLSIGAIDFGILVDGAVVMIENILRRLARDGKDMGITERNYLVSAAAREVGTPIVFGIAVIITTFLPIFSFSGVEGKLFRPLALTMVSALIGAAIATLTLLPVLCSFLLTRHRVADRQSPILSFYKRIYKPVLVKALDHPYMAISASLIVFISSIGIFLNTGQEFLPHLEEGNIWLRATLKPSSVSLPESTKIAGEIRSILRTFPEVRSVLSQVGGPDDGTDPARFSDQEYLVDLKPASQWRHRFGERKDKLIAEMKDKLQEIPGVSYYFTQYIQTTLDEALSGVQGSLVAKISGPDLAALESLATSVGHIMRGTPGIVDVIVDPLLGQPQFAIEVDRKQAARYGINVEDVQSLVEIAIGGKSATQFIDGERRFNVMVRLRHTYRDTKDAIENILIDTPSGQKIPLSQVAFLKESVGATQIWRESGFRMATIRANVRGRDLASAVEDAQEHVRRDIPLPEHYQILWSGEFERQREASQQLSVVLPITLVVIITILFLSCGTVKGALVMFSVVPLASIGAFAALYITGTYFSIAAGVGLIALFGVAVQNGILMVFFINELRHEGMSIREAAYNGALTRMRPVLMTATVASLGLLPAAISNEIGSQTQKPFAIVIIGGLISSTILTLIVLPALYQLVAPDPGKRRQSTGLRSEVDS
ncbi:MAG: efflux RND transporter permease subunit, partial [Cyanobacteria bacterium HKST-UBA02]|nr:efflux RND transporter permease subunit [Cyanobacteria bacterium HKST-UBA02]